jgi:hypothetical protein
VDICYDTKEIAKIVRLIEIKYERSVGMAKPLAKSVVSGMRGLVWLDKVTFLQVMEDAKRSLVLSRSSNKRANLLAIEAQIRFFQNDLSNGLFDIALPDIMFYAEDADIKEFVKFRLEVGK